MVGRPRKYATEEERRAAEAARKAKEEADRADEERRQREVAEKLKKEMEMVERQEREKEAKERKARDESMSVLRESTGLLDCEDLWKVGLRCLKVCLITSNRFQENLTLS